ncbi:mid region of cactin-domain-containing protein [Leucosporidium creatinivorum]|uniref:Splicing factor Cactin n=1 Tax=Leucosporidium creatinivorum TaxID=106004 RepID=A0A1Y2EPG5_9BASI|nr:mid region of cactin-domain-containing protein [Leucosporidium creatinivorum]
MPADDRRDYRDRDRDRDRDYKRRSASPEDRHHRSSRDDERSSKRSRRDEDRDSDRRRDKDRESSSRHHDRDGRDYRDKDRGRDRDRESKKDKEKKPRETSTERAARKAERKAQKAADAALLLPQDARQAAAETSFYSSTDNPFHDANLGDKFVWGKKREKERKSGITPEEAAAKDRQRHLESMEEIEKLNQRRAQREAEFALREEEQMRAARMAESAQMSAWIDREDDFHLEQSKKRAEIRVRERRAKPIDFLALNLKWSQPPLQPGDEGYEEEQEDEGLGLEIDMDEPYVIFDNLTLEDSEELHEDIKMYLSLEKSEANLEFWRSLLIVSSASLEALRNERAIGINAYAAQTRANAAVKAEITRLLSGKTYDQLVALQGQVQRKLASGEPVDVEYWEGLLKELIVWKAKGKLRDMHEIVLGNRLEQLRKKQRDEALRIKDDLKHALVAPHAARATEVEEAEGDEEEEEMDVEQPEEEEPDVVVAQPWDPSLEPKQLKKIPEELKNCEVVEVDEQRNKLFAQRRKIVSTRFVAKPRVGAPAPAPKTNNKDEEIYQAAVGQGLDEEEELFNMEVEMSKSAYSWEDKYRPRKPRYFNKVHTGYEWNKYNQTHYDSDNPPPKVVQGYKFNLFYPDLIDKTKAPQYRVIKEKGNDDTCTLLFSAGPPYEDLAFTIVNKDWERGHQRGFRSSFDRGVLQLHFSFKRTFYRK